MTPDWFAGILGLTITAVLVLRCRVPVWAAYIVALLAMGLIWVGHDLLFGPYRPW